MYGNETTPSQLPHKSFRRALSISCRFSNSRVPEEVGRSEDSLGIAANSSVTRFVNEQCNMKARKCGNSDKVETTREEKSGRDMSRKRKG